MKKEKHQYQLRKVPYPKMKREVWEEKSPRVFLRGQMYWASIEGKNGNLTKRRPVVILSNNKCNDHGNDLTVVPMTSRDKKEWMPTHVKLMVNTPGELSTAKCEYLTTVKEKVGNYIRTLNPREIERVTYASMIQIGII